MIREATAADKPRIVEMAARFLLESQYGEIFEHRAAPEKIAALVDSVLRIGAIFVAEEGTLIEGEFGPEMGPTRLAGMLAIVVVPHLFTGLPYGDEIAWWVEPEHRNSRIAYKLLRSAEEWATSRGANMVKMSAPAGSKVGEFYERMGYKAVESAFIKSI